MNLTRTITRVACISFLTLSAYSVTATKPSPDGQATTHAQSIDILHNATTKATYPLPDFSYAGYNNGIGDLPTISGTILNVTDYGVIADDEIDDSQALLEALDVAHTTRGPVTVMFPAGKIIVSEILKIKRGDIVLRGMGSGQQGTVLFFPRPLAMMEGTESLKEIRDYLVKYDKRQRVKDRNIDILFSEYSWTGGLIWIQKDGTRPAAYLEELDPPMTVLSNAIAGRFGSQDVTVADTSRLAVGDVVELQWFNREGETGPLLKEIYGDTDLKIGSHHWTFENRPLVRQKTKIVNISGNTVRISDPLLHNISTKVPAQFAQWSHIERVGIEDMRISFPESIFFGHHLERGYTGIYMTSVYDGWIRDVTFENADSGILSYNSANLTIKNIETTGDRRAHYSVHLGNVHNVLVDGLTVTNEPVHSLSFNTQSTRNVFKDSLVYHGAVLDQHAGSNHQNLFDNVTFFVDAERDEKGPFYPVWNGSGAPYWQPGHGRYNTTWNLKVNVRSGAQRNETVRLQGLAEGPDARIIGVSGNRNFELEYAPTPYSDRINRDMDDVPSLYQYQLNKRLGR